MPGWFVEVLEKKRLEELWRRSYKGVELRDPQPTPVVPARGRGGPSAGPSLVSVVGFTPARAGQPTSPPCLSWVYPPRVRGCRRVPRPRRPTPARVHPRVCGWAASVGAFWHLLLQGSPPHTRGRELPLARLQRPPPVHSRTRGVAGPDDVATRRRGGVRLRGRIRGSGCRLRRAMFSEFSGPVPAIARPPVEVPAVDVHAVPQECAGLPSGVAVGL